MKFPLSFIEKNYNTKVSKYFYTKNEIDKFKGGWNNGQRPNDKYSNRSAEGYS